VADWQIDDASYQHWIRHVETPWRDSLELPDASVNDDDSWPLISIVIPTFNTPALFLQQALESVLAQSYPKWQLCIADDASTDPEVGKAIQHYLERDPRISAILRDCNGGIAQASNSALALTRGQYVAFMDHDDTLPDHALMLVARELRSHPDTQLLYSDSDSLNTSGQRCNPFFKPDWNYDLLLGQNYLNHLSVYSSQLIRDIDGLRENFDGSQDYDLALRAIENIAQGKIRHLPHILYHWRVVPSAVSQTRLGQAVKAGRRAIAEHFERSDQAATVGAAKNAIIYNRVNWQTPQPPPGVLILIPGGDDKLKGESVEAINRLTDYENFRIKVLACEGQATSSTLGTRLNAEFRNINEDLVCIIPAGVCPESGDWLQLAAGQLDRVGIGALGMKLMSCSGQLLTGPLLPGVGTQPGQGFDGALESDKGYFGRLMLDHQVSAVSGACLATRRSHYALVGGFNPDLSDLALLGADYCLRLQQEELATLWLASAPMRCPDGLAQSTFPASPSDQELAYFRELWPHKVQYDPFYNANFSTGGTSYHLPD